MQDEPYDDSQIEAAIDLIERAIASIEEVWRSEGAAQAAVGQAWPWVRRVLGDELDASVRSMSASQVREALAGDVQLFGDDDPLSALHEWLDEALEAMKAGALDEDEVAAEAEEDDE